MSPRSFAAAMGRFSRTNRLSRRSDRRRRCRLMAEPLEPRAMLATVATLSSDLSPYTKIPVTFRRADGTVGFSNTAYVGQLGWSGMSGDAAVAGVPATFKSFCIDGLQFVSAGKATTFSGFSPALAAAPLGGAPTIGPARASLLESFWRQYGPATAAGFGDKTDAAAFQLAVWEIINDAAATGTRLAADLTSGQFSVGAAGRTLPAYLRAQQWLAGFDTTAPARSPVVLYALQSSTAQDQIVPVPIADLDVDSDNTGDLTRSAVEEGMEEQPGRPGVLVPVGGDRVPMVVELPAGQSATLEILEGADKVAVWTAASGGQRILSLQAPTNVITAGATLWIEALAPSPGLADVAFRLSVSGGPGLPASGDTVRATAVAVDLDVDSNNDGGIDANNGPAGTDDPIEATAGRGLVVPVHAGDQDGDAVADTRDFDGIAGRSFVPLKVSVNWGAALAWKEPVSVVGAANRDLPGLAFTFTFSDAGLGPDPAGTFRIWTKDARFARTDQDRVASGRPVSAADLLQLAPPADMAAATLTHGTFTLYLEVVTAADVHEPIAVRLGGAGAWAKAVTTDVVHARGFVPELDLDVDSNNDDGFGRPQRSAWEEKLEDHKYGLGKLVLQSSPDPLDASGSAPLVDAFTPVVVALPRNLPVDARSIGVEFDLTGFTPVSAGDIRLWTRDKGAGLRDVDAAGELLDGQLQAGHRIQMGSRYTLGQVNYDPATGEAVLYMDGFRATNRVTLNDVETMGRGTRGLKATLSFGGPVEKTALATDDAKYIVVGNDFFYSDFQKRLEVRSALASRGAYEFADMPNFSLKRLTREELEAFLGADNPDRAAIADMLYNDDDTADAPTRYPGFKAVLYQDYAAVADNTFILAFGGTDDTLDALLHRQGYDWLENIAQGTGYESFQYQHAMTVARAVDQALLDMPAATLTTTGHSLGGGLASAASVASGATGITFNAAGLHPNTIRQFFKDPAELGRALARFDSPQHLVKAYTVDWDFLSNFQDRLSPPIYTALGSKAPLDGPYDFAIGAIDWVGRVFSAIPPTFPLPVAGTVIQLGVQVAVKAGTGYFMVQAHSMTSVLWGLLVTEGVLGARRDLLGYDASKF